MNWITKGNRYLSSPYQILSSIKGFECWLKTPERYCVLARQLPSLSAAKDFCELHKAKEAAHV